MSFLSGGSWTSDPRERSAQRLVEQRRAVASDQLAEATLACPACDAPVVVGPTPLTVTQPIRCPFCARRGPIRAFLSLRTPTRPNRVVVRISLPGGRR